MSIKADTHIYSVYKELVKGVVKNIRNGYEAKYFEQQAAPMSLSPFYALFSSLWLTPIPCIVPSLSLSLTFSLAPVRAPVQIREARGC